MCNIFSSALIFPPALLINMFLVGVGIEIFNNLTKISVFSHLNDIVKLFGRNFCYLATSPPHTAENAPGLHSRE